MRGPLDSHVIGHILMLVSYRALDEELLQPYRTHNWYKAQLIRRCNEKIAEQLEAQKALAVPKVRRQYLFPNFVSTDHDPDDFLARLISLKRL